MKPTLPRCESRRTRRRAGPRNRQPDSDRLTQLLHPETEKPLVAIGYLFEFGHGQLEFDLCANTSANLKEALDALPANSPGGSADDVRWNSADFDYPAAISDRFDGFSDDWWEEWTKFNRLEKAEDNRQMVYDGIVEICCQSLADFARRGVIKN